MMPNENMNLRINEKMDENEISMLANKVMHEFIPMRVLSSIIDMGVLKIIYDHVGLDGLSPTEIATRINTQNPNAPEMLDRMLRLLATYSVVRCTTVVSAEHGSVERRYNSSPVTKHFVPNQGRFCEADMLKLQTSKAFYQSWSKLEEAVFKGESPFYLAHGMHIYDYTSKDPVFDETFNNVMNGHSIVIMKSILEKYRGFENIKRLVDVGGVHGHNLHLIVSKYPSIQGINFDLPHVVQHAPQHLGVEHIGGDMFECIPKGDAILLKWMLHNWDDEHCLELLRNCYKSLPGDGKVIVIEYIIPDEPDASEFSKLLSIIDVTMMTQLSGKERSSKDFESLAKAAGFSISKFNVFQFSIMEFYKTN